jgi:hypothetical protein
MTVETVFNWAVWVHLASTLFMVGVIWYVQLVHYPLMSAVDPQNFREFHQQHTRRTGWLVIPPMVLELATAIALVAPGTASVPSRLGVPGLAILALVWVLTFGVQVPLHRRLAGGYDAGVHRQLVRTNWLRTAAWSVRGALAVAIALMAGR